MNDCNSTNLISSDNPLFYELQDEEEALSPVKTRFTKYQLFCHTYFRLFPPGKRRRSLEFLLKTLTIHKGSWTTTRRCSARRSTNFARSPEKVGFGITIRCQLSSSQTSLLSQKMLIRFGKKHFDFLEECVMLPKQKMELALKISQNPKKFWIIKPPGWSFICGVNMLKVFSAEAPMQILQSVMQSCSYSSSIIFRKFTSNFRKQPRTRYLFDQLSPRYPKRSQRRTDGAKVESTHRMHQ